MSNPIVEQSEPVTNNQNQRSQEFAQMNGVEVKNYLITETTSESNDSAPTELEEIVTIRPVASHPLLKGLTISGGVLLLVLIFASMMGGLMAALNSSNNNQDNKTVKNTQENQPKNEEKEGDIKTAMAITSQKGELQAIVKKRNNNVAVSSTPTPVATPTTTAVTVRSQPIYQPPPPSTIVNRPTRVAYNPPLRQQFSVVQKSQPKPVTTVRPNNNLTTNFQPLPLPSRTTSKDPMQEWLTAGNVGNYSSNNDEVNNQQPDLRNAQVEGGTGLRSISASENQNSSSTSPIPNYDGKRVLVGTRVAGVLETPLAWTGGNVNQQGQTSLIKLVEPLKAFDNQEVLPKGSYIVASIITTNSEIVQMTATAALINIGGRTQEKQLPANFILILGKNGKLLKAESRKGGSGLGNSLMASLLSGLSKVAEIQNRANSQTTISSLGTITTTVNNPDKDLVAGFAEGSFNEILSRMKNANERQLQGLQQQQQVFVIEAGKEVQVFVNQSILI